MLKKVEGGMRVQQKEIHFEFELHDLPLTRRPLFTSVLLYCAFLFRFLSLVSSRDDLDCTKERLPGRAGADRSVLVLSEYVLY